MAKTQDKWKKISKPTYVETNFLSILDTDVPVYDVCSCPHLTPHHYVLGHLWASLKSLHLGSCQVWLTLVSTDDVECL